MLDKFRQQVAGMASLILADDPSWNGDLKKALLEEILPAAQHGNISFFLNFDRIPVGFLTWALLSQESEARILATGDASLHISEWNEGESLWIRWLHLPKRLFSEAIPLCLHQLFPTHEEARMLVGRKNGVMALELNRSIINRLPRFVNLDDQRT